MKAFIDADIAISIYNLRPQALSWLQANNQIILLMTTMAWMEVIRGAKDKLDQQKLTLYLARYSIVYLIDEDEEWAMRQYETYHLSHGVGILDCYIAAPGYRLQLPLYTRNVKHM